MFLLKTASLCSYIQWTVLHVQRPHSQVVEPCMVDVIKASSPVPKLFQFCAALQYQLHFFLNKADLCPHIPYDELKGIALESGMICCPVERN